MIRLLFLGAPGTGKGTISSYLKENHNFFHISSGDLFRLYAKDESSELGKEIKNCINNGIYVPDDLTNKTVKDFYNKNKDQEKIIFDGYPRTLNQCDYLNDVVQITHAILLEPTDWEYIINRLSSRRSCPECKRIYNISSEEFKPKVDNQCDVCKIELLHRKDDDASVVKKRIEVYNEQTKPVIEYYKNKNLLYTIDANADLKELYELVLNIVNKK
ncbi:nucleoside monophosphate kinase [Mycoplasma bradburyae]|uniref:Adenylate kinase n=1 Tax=Mycoplasma bradburyae TaxID=2963128 RepID=A0AAW6HPW6_9MOLU|nr:nucleoside monophosphate kinase [Mycoplasma bradburyae]MDC4163285.1 nucleoside monophosphate kinase [Mycoplasma bradburyae]MDC4181899.1 nucleoside monophosphate kinase [Mycoplasma bradburyae]MDC4182598.1 nucleoside monophosphate kinase [Mycoplasma bradburyae]MDC4183276.1 nucleoside monophosphate kinase [Mycoplasma bradburyae]MDC4184082.1 nucleoside monophosphate kinase [Mycoplasma bradburyae]